MKFWTHSHKIQKKIAIHSIGTSQTTTSITQNKIQKKIAIKPHVWHARRYLRLYPQNSKENSNTSMPGKYIISRLPLTQNSKENSNLQILQRFSTGLRGFATKFKRKQQFMLQARCCGTHQASVRTKFKRKQQYTLSYLFVFAKPNLQNSKENSNYYHKSQQSSKPETYPTKFKRKQQFTMPQRRSFLYTYTVLQTKFKRKQQF